jgi:hypothetical protein
MKILVPLLMSAACTTPPSITIPYHQDFSSPLGKEWSSTGGGWQLADGRLYNDGARNVPLWLDAELPADVRVTFDAESKSDAVDFKFEIFGDGRHHESGYIVIFAGWNNSRSIIARLAEHGERHDGVRTPAKTAELRAEVEADPAIARERHRGRKEIIQRSVRLEPSRVYRVRFERKGTDLKVFVDGEPHIDLFDPSPLSGRGHDRFAFNNWASQIYFDNLTIEPL